VIGGGRASSHGARLMTLAPERSLCPAPERIENIHCAPRFERVGDSLHEAGSSPGRARAGSRCAPLMRRRGDEVVRNGDQVADMA
jgi:hypothetical protein